MLWRKKPVRIQLIEARAEVQRQIDFLRAPSRRLGRATQSGELIRRLQANIAHIDERLASLAANGSPRA